MVARKQANGVRHAVSHAADGRGVAGLVRETAGATLLYETKNPLPAETRARVVALLNERLADCVDLQSQAKQAHWNVKGPQFIALHKLFDEIYEAIGEYVDLIAERITQLGGVAEGTVRVSAGRSSLTDYPLTLSSGEEHVAALSGVLAQFGGKLLEAVSEVDELDDPDTSDILIEISRGIDKWLWFVEAHQQERPASSNSRPSKR